MDTRIFCILTSGNNTQIYRERIAIQYKFAMQHNNCKIWLKEKDFASFSSFFLFHEMKREHFSPAGALDLDRLRICHVV